jgi:hypothetical protein
MSVSLVARQHGISGSQVFTWRRLMSQSALTAAAAGEEVVPASEYRAGDAGARVATVARQEGHGERTAPRGCVPGRRPKKTAAALDLVARGWSVTAVADALDISRQHLSAMRNRPPPRPRGRPPLPGAELVADIRMLVAGLPTYGYRRAHALLRRQAEKNARESPMSNASTAS